MKKLFITLAIALLASTAWGAKQNITTIAAPATLGAFRTAVNGEFAKAESNFVELYANKSDASCFTSESAFNACFDLTWATSGTFDEAGDYTLTGEWDFSGATVTGLSGGSMTWPSSGGIAVYDGSSAWGTSIAASSLLVGDCTVGPCLDGTSDGGNIIKLWAGTGSYWTALQGGAPAANRSWRLPIAAPPSSGTTYLMNMDEYGQMGFLATSTYLTPTGSAASLTSFPTLNQNTTGSAATLTTARTIGGVSFNGSANINLPGVNASGTQNTSGTAAGITGLTLPTPTTSGQSYASTGAGVMGLVEDTVMSANATSFVSAADYPAMRQLLDATQPVCFTIPATVEADDYPIFKAPQAITITGGTIRVYAIGGTNVVGGLDECTGTNGTCGSVTAVDADITGTAGNEVADDGTLANGAIASGNWVRWHTTSVSGTNTSLSACFSYTLD